MATTTVTLNYTLKMSASIKNTSYTAASKTKFIYGYSNRVMEDTTTTKISLTDIPANAIFDSVKVTTSPSSYVNSTGIGYYSGSTKKNIGDISTANLTTLLENGYRTIWIDAYMYHLGSSSLTFTESQGATYYQTATASCTVKIVITYHTGLDIPNAVVGYSIVNQSGTKIWQPVALYYYDGTAWQDVELYRYDGTSWTKRDMRTD